MSDRHAWLAVENGDRAAVLDMLGLEEIGDVSDGLDAPISCAALPGGWLLVVYGERFSSIDQIPTISTAGLAIACEVNDVVMFSQIRAFREGRQVWAVIHDPDQDHRGVRVEGEPPPQFHEIKARLEADQAADAELDVDHIFDLPPELSASICGYRSGRSHILEWKALQRRDPRRPRPAKIPSLADSIQSEIVPLLQSRGWEIDPISSPYDVVREVGDTVQRIWFDYDDGVGFHLIVFFGVGIPSPNRRTLIQGRMWQPTPRKSLLQRFMEMGQPQRPTDGVGYLIEKARDEVTAVSAFLDGGHRDPRVTILQGVAKDTWPEIPEERLAASPPGSI